MSVKARFAIVASLFALAAALILYVYFVMSRFWLLVPGVAGVAVFGPWSYYLHAKVKGPQRSTHGEVIAATRIEMKIKEKK